MTIRKKIVLFSLIIFILSFGVRVYGIGRQDETWDELPNVVHGQIYMGALKNLNFSREVWEIGSDHFPFAKYIYGLSMQIPKRFEAIKNWDSEFPEGRNFSMPRVTAALLGSLTVVVVFLIGYLVSNFWGGVYSSVIYSFLPYVVGHNRVAGLETPLTFFLSLFFLSIFYALKTKRYGYIVTSGIFLGLGIACRFDLVIFIIVYPLLLLFHQKTKVGFRYLSLGGLLSLLTPLIVWPWFWVDKFNLYNIVFRVLQTTTGRIEYFLGTFGNPPNYYYLVYVVSTTPIIILLIFLLSSYTYTKRKNGINILLILIWLLIPFSASFSGYKQDGLRYIFHFLPAFSLFCGIGLSEWFNQRGFNEKVRFISLFLYFFISLFTLHRYYPYYLDYYNLTVGGPKKVYEENLLEFGWWGEGLYEAVEFVNSDAKEGDKVVFAVTPYHTLPKLREDLILHISPIQYGEYVVVNSQYERYSIKWLNRLKAGEEFKDYKLVKTVEVKEAPLVKIYNLPAENSALLKRR